MILYTALVLLSHMYKKECLKKSFFAPIYQQVLKLVIKTSKAFTSSFNFKLLKLLLLHSVAWSRKRCHQNEIFTDSKYS